MGVSSEDELPPPMGEEGSEHELFNPPAPESEEMPEAPEAPESESEGADFAPPEPEQIENQEQNEPQEVSPERPEGSPAPVEKVDEQKMDVGEDEESGEESASEEEGEEGEEDEKNEESDAPSDEEVSKEQVELEWKRNQRIREKIEFEVSGRAPIQVDEKLQQIDKQIALDRQDKFDAYFEELRESNIFADVAGEEGTFIWKVDGQKLKVVDEEEFGTFYHDDVYLILGQHYEKSDKKYEKGTFMHFIHIWCGAGVFVPTVSDHDEKKQVKEKEDMERRSPLKNRDKLAVAGFQASKLKTTIGAQNENVKMLMETMNKESAQFMSYFFENGQNLLKYKEGASGKSIFRAVKSYQELHLTSLIQVSGKTMKTIQVAVLEPYIANLASCSAYILEAWDIVYVWKGSKCPIASYGRACELASQLCFFKKNENKHRTRCTVFEGNWKDKDLLDFYTRLAEGEGALPSSDMCKDMEATRADAEPVEVDDPVVIKIFWNVTEEDPEGSLAVTVVSPKNDENVPLKRSKLIDSRSALLMNCESQIFCWVGKKCPSGVREKLLRLATAFQTKKEEWCRDKCLVWMMEDCESPIFRAKFLDWQTPLGFKYRTKPLAKFYPKLRGYILNLVKKKKPSIKAETVYSQIEEYKPKELVAGDMADFSQLVCYQIVGSKWQLVPKEDYGIFCSKCSYVVIYTRVDEEDSRANIYFWEGRHCDRINLLKQILMRSPSLCSGIKERLQMNPSCYLILENREPNEFLNLFRRIGGLGDNSGIVSTKDTEILSSDEKTVKSLRNYWLKHAATTKVMGDHKQMFHLRSQGGILRAHQVDACVRNLNSGDVFIVRSKDNIYQWQGRYCDKETVDLAYRVIDRFKGKGRKVVEVPEGKESKRFWEQLEGNPLNYTKCRKDGNDKNMFTREPYFFQTYQTQYGSFRYKKFALHTWSQDQLLPECCVILDCHSYVFTWIGPKANKRCRKNTFKLAKQISKLDAKYRPYGVQGCPLKQETQESESDMFKSMFHGWGPVYQEKDYTKLTYFYLKKKKKKEKKKPKAAGFKMWAGK